MYMYARSATLQPYHLEIHQLTSIKPPSKFGRDRPCLPFLRYIIGMSACACADATNPQLLRTSLMPNLNTIDQDVAKIQQRKYVHFKRNIGTCGLITPMMLAISQVIESLGIYQILT